MDLGKVSKQRGLFLILFYIRLLPKLIDLKPGLDSLTGKRAD